MESTESVVQQVKQFVDKKCTHFQQEQEQDESKEAQYTAQMAELRAQYEGLRKKYKEAQTARDEAVDRRKKRDEEMKSLMLAIGGPDPSPATSTPPRNILTPMESQDAREVDDAPSEESHCLKNNNEKLGVASSPTDTYIHSKKEPLAHCPPNTAPESESIQVTTPIMVPDTTQSSTTGRNFRSLDTSQENARSLFFRARFSNKGITDEYPTVAELDDRWTEICCAVCGANSSYDTGYQRIKFFRGAIGLHNHIQSHRSHGTAKPDMEATIKCFRRRELSQEDTDLIMNGQEPKVKIEMRQRGAVDMSVIEKYLRTPPIAPASFIGNDGLERFTAGGQVGTFGTSIAPHFDERVSAKRSRQWASGECDRDDEDGLAFTKRPRRE